MRGLYAIVDVSATAAQGVDLIDFASAVLRSRPAALQLRAKGCSPRDVLALLRNLAPLCRLAGVPLFANDRPDLAALAGCSGVHVGQTDVPVGLARRLAPGLRIGLSTHTVAQLVAALEARPDYVAYGPVFPTTSKADADPTVGLNGLEKASRLAAAAGVPLVAIGGITLVSASEVGDRAQAAAIIGDLLSPSPSGMDAVSRHAMALHEALGGQGEYAEGYAHRYVDAPASTPFM